MSSYAINSPVHKIDLWERLLAKKNALAFTLDLTARCNLDCRHCYINVPTGDQQAKAKEITQDEVVSIGRQAVELGAVWCTLSGGEPLLRPDFSEIYLSLKRLGLLVSVYTNATAVKAEHVELFKKYPPRDLEVTVYGVTRATYERVTRRPGSFDAFMHGLDMLVEAGVNVRLKAMAIRSNVDEFQEIAEFCQERTKDYFRFDPVLHLRLDQNALRNIEIMEERLTPAEVVALENADRKRKSVLVKNCDFLIQPEQHFGCDNPDCACHKEEPSAPLLGCGAGIGGFSITWDNKFRICSSLASPEMDYDLRVGSLRDAWERFVPQVRGMRTKNVKLLTACKSCAIVSLCKNCPAHAYLEVGNNEAVVPYFCEVAHARADNLQLAVG